MMKFYNPFKWHIVDFLGGFAVSKKGIFGGRAYLDKDSVTTWAEHEQVKKYCLHETEQDAVQTHEKTRPKFVRTLG